MKKIVLLISITLLFFSCSKSIYYEYSNNGRYAALEMKNKILAIYRSNSCNFIYTESAAVFTANDNVNYIEFSLPYRMYYIEENQDKFNQCGFVFKTKEDKYKLVTYKKINKDSIVSISQSDRDEFLKLGSCFVENNVNWLPPYFTRVKKIDYKKFNLPEVKDEYLKDPIKAPKVYNK